MRIILELDDKQTDVFQNVIETTLQALVWQETQLKQAIDDYLPREDGSEWTKDPEWNNLNDYLAKIVPQRILFAEILHNVQQAEKKTSITTDLSMAPKGLRGENLFDN